ncbi:MAG: hypothetical protein JO348_01720 [Alphaproteobacteria bacterium]|nr:hypothetical protein [Alphaproteobacteria bacterium]MBV9540690.1 hypothetical protein [Alphaproteobacteria bacterium]MBV9905351.1 hypothetical protein [Alphaproteobacteria bacterium]
MLRKVLLAAGLALGLCGCTDMDFDLFGDDAPVVDANGCTAAGCPQAETFCRNRGYQAGSPGMQRCIYSVEQNLRASR